MKYDRNKLTDATKRHAFTAELAQIPVAPWNLSAQTALAQWNSDLTRLLAKHFPKSEATPRKPYISNDTWQLVLYKKAAFQILNHAKTVGRNWSVRLAFHNWGVYAKGSARPGHDERAAEVPPPEGLQAALTTVQQVIVFCVNLIDLLTRPLKTAIWNDRTQWVSNIEKQMVTYCF